MVLEGLKRAEQFIGLLRQAGYQHPNGKVLKPEHLDQDFEVRQNSLALLALINGLNAHILTVDEVARIEYLAELGLLDGLLEGLDDDDDDEPIPKIVNPSMERLEKLNSHYEELYEAQALEEERLRAGINSILLPGVKVLEKVVPEIIELGIIEQVSVANTDTLNSLLNSYCKLHNELILTLNKSIDTLQSPIDTFHPDEPIMHFKTINNMELFHRSWDPKDYAFYMAKIDSAIVQLESLGLYVCRKDLLRGEDELRNVRLQLQKVALFQFMDLHKQRLALNCIIFKILEDSNLYLMESAKEAKDLLETINSKVNPIRAYIKAPPVVLSSLAQKSQPSQNQHLHLQLLSNRLGEIKDAYSIVDNIVKGLIDEKPEVSPIPKSVRTTEDALRSCTISLSNTLSTATTESTRVRLYYDNSH